MALANVPMFVDVAVIKTAIPAVPVPPREPMTVAEDAANVAEDAAAIKAQNDELFKENQKLRERVALAVARNRLIEERRVLLAIRQAQQCALGHADACLSPPPGLSREGEEKAAPLMIEKHASDLSDSASTAAASSGCESDSGTDDVSGDGAQNTDNRTTVIMRNIPSKCTRSQLLSVFEKAGFNSDIAMAYLPIDFSTHAAFGYAFVFLNSTDGAIRFLKFFHGFSDWEGKCAAQKMCSVSWCAEQEALEVHIERYRNSPVMHESVPDSYKPVLFSEGQRIPFPSPSKRIRKPRVLGGRQTWNQ